jgi:diguanylate cyclase (GGDEF)-like protein
MSKPGSWENLRARLAREQTMLVSLAIAYFLAGKAGLALSFGHPAATLVWPSSGIALAAFIVFGYRIWPVVFGAATVLYASTLGPVSASLALATGNTLEGLLASYLVNRFAGGRHALQSPRNVLRFSGVVLLASTTVTAPFNAIVLILSGHAYWTDYGTLWLVLCLGSLVGMLVATPAILLNAQGFRLRLRPKLAAEGCAAIIAIAAISVLVFQKAPAELRGFPSELLCLPLLVWVAFRLGRRTASAALLALMAFAAYGTLHGYGPFVRSTPLASLTIVQLFIAINAVITFSLAALAAEYTVAEAQLRELVVTDPLTGLPNYRRLLEVLSFEIARADRNHQELAVVFFDMDGLKDINDEHGHLVGSRAVCRFAETLRSACRTTDTAARYGGDEFVAVLSDTDYEGARLVVRRLTERLTEDVDRPSLSVSAGIAVYPRDGGTPTTLLSAADRALYAVKAEKASAKRRNIVGLREWTNAAGSN